MDSRNRWLDEQIDLPPVDIQMNPLDDNITNWKTDPTALAAGFFDPANMVATPWATLGKHVSADGFDFYYGNNSTFNGDAFVARWGPGNIRAVDTTTHELITVVSGLRHPLAVLRVPGRFLLADSNAIRYLRFVGDPVPEPRTCWLLATVAALWQFICLRASSSSHCYELMKRTENPPI